MKAALAPAAAFWIFAGMTPLQAQEMDHSMHGSMQMDEAAKEDTQGTPSQDPPSGPMDHSVMDHSTMDHGAMDHGTMDHGTMDHAATPAEGTENHVHTSHAMTMPAAAAPIPHAPPPPEAFTGPAHAADIYYPDGTMDHSRHMMAQEMGGFQSTLVMLDRLEVQPRQGREGFAFEGSLRTGGDIDRLWLDTEGEGRFGEGFEQTRIDALWGHAIGPWFDLKAGLSQQINTGPDRTRLALGVEGLAPYMFDILATAYLSPQGELTARIEANTDQRLTQRLILQPRIEAYLSAQDMPALATGSGLTSLDAGVRLRYEFRRELAPYIGVEWHKQFGRTADYARNRGDDPDALVALVGLRIWF